MIHALMIFSSMKIRGIGCPPSGRSSVPDRTFPSRRIRSRPHRKSLGRDGMGDMFHAGYIMRYISTMVTFHGT